MRTLYNKKLAVISVGIGILAFTTFPAKAQDFSLHLEPAVATPMTAPQSTIFGPGMALGAKGMFALDNHWSVGPNLSGIYLPRLENTDLAAGTAWTLGGSLRLQGDRSVDETRNLLAGWSPWIDADMGLAYTGHIPMVAFDVGVGEEMAFDRAHNVWGGPFLRLTHMFQTADNSAGEPLNKSDVNIFQAGWSLSFDFPPRTYEHTQVITRVVQMAPVVVVVNNTPETPAPATAPEQLSLTERVFFERNSATLDWQSRDKLDEVAKKLAARPRISVLVEGHASTDGQKNYNQALSARRAEVVRDYLVAHGVAAERLVGLAHGVNMPAADNTTQEGRERSRRVEFTITFTGYNR